jgi:hypothetical protein
VKKASILLTFLIVLSVGCAEIPELLSFCDDVSNDFVETVGVRRANAAPQIIQQEPNCASWLLPRESNICIGSDRPSPQRLPLSGQELLLLLSIHRK